MIIDNIKLPTHFRFKNKKEAKYWNRTIEDWIPIHNINVHESGYSISSYSFAWIETDINHKNLEFSIRSFIKCKNCCME